MADALWGDKPLPGGDCPRSDVKFRISFQPASVADGGDREVSSNLLLDIKACYLTNKNATSCIVCGRKNKQMHLPIGRIGEFCEHCCPACGKAHETRMLFTKVTRLVEFT